jgi:hypothetical protein
MADMQHQHKAWMARLCHLQQTNSVSSEPSGDALLGQQEPLARHDDANISAASGRQVSI